MAEGPECGNVVIIHPGSLYLRTGLASWAAPQRTLHCLARRRREGGATHRDSFLVPRAQLDGRAEQALEEAGLQVLQALARAPLKDGSGREPPSSDRVAELNAGMAPEEVEELKAEPTEWGEVVVGDKVADLPADLPYNIHLPFRRGDLHLHPGVGGSLSSVLVDLQAVWEDALQRQLGILRQDFGRYKAVLVIPALYSRGLVKHLVSLLLTSIGFGGCFVVQDHVAATFGAGLQAACVVDVGDQKTSVSCVEDGVSLPSSRIQLGYGGSDLTQLLLHLSRQTGFPYTTCSPETSPSDALLLHAMKEERCSLKLDQCSLQRHLFTAAGKRYSVYLGDETRAAPLGLFQQELLRGTGPAAAAVLGPDPGDPQDPHDHLYLRETSRKYTRGGEPTPGGEGEEFDDAVDPEPQGGLKLGPEALPLHLAVLRSVESCPGEELRRKLLGSVLLVGGGLRFPGAAAHLQDRLQALVGPQGPPCEVTVDPKDGDSDQTCWRGAAVLAGLESARELWIRPAEWTRLGQRLLRERAPFPWA